MRSGAGLPSPSDAPDVIEAFKRADKAAEDVKTNTRADDVKVRINHLLEEFRSLWRSAAKGR